MSPRDLDISPDDDGPSLVRPYAMVRGRTRAPGLAPIPVEAIVVTELADLEARLVSVPSQLPGREGAGNLVLGGHEGRFKRPRYRSEPSSDREFGIGGQVMGNCLGCPGMLYHAFVLDDGRPVIISIDWWTLAFGTLPSEYVGRILSSFRLIG